jgi:hypothetical protein
MTTWTWTQAPVYVAATCTQADPPVVSRSVRHRRHHTTPLQPIPPLLLLLLLLLMQGAHRKIFKFVGTWISRKDVL